jgi:hypothetical protein
MHFQERLQCSLECRSATSDVRDWSRSTTCTCTNLNEMNEIDQNKVSLQRRVWSSSAKHSIKLWFANPNWYGFRLKQDSFCFKRIPIHEIHRLFFILLYVSIFGQAKTVVDNQISKIPISAPSTAANTTIFNQNKYRCRYCFIYDC